MNRQQYGLGVSLTAKVKVFMGLPRSLNVVMRKTKDGYQVGTMPEGYNDPTHKPAKKKRPQLENVQFFREEADARAYADRLLAGGL